MQLTTTDATCQNVPASLDVFVHDKSKEFSTSTYFEIAQLTLANLLRFDSLTHGKDLKKNMNKCMND